MSPFPTQQRAITLTESGALLKAMALRKRRSARKRLLRMRLRKMSRFLFRDFDKSINRLVGKALASVIYSLWKRGHFDRYEEFSSSEQNH